MVLVEKKTQKCPKCGGILIRNFDGSFKCMSCKTEFEDIPFTKPYVKFRRYYSQQLNTQTEKDGK